MTALTVKVEVADSTGDGTDTFRLLGGLPARREKGLGREASPVPQKFNTFSTFSTFDVPGTVQTYAFGINDAGHIVGFALVLPDVPEPGSLVLFSVGLLALGLAWREQHRAA